QQDAWQPLVPQPSVVVRLSGGLDPAAGAELVASVADQLGDDVPFGAIYPVVAVATGDANAGDLSSVEMEIAPEKTCPWGDLTDAERRTDPRCNVVLHGGPFGTIVDDGTLMTELGIADDR